MTTEPMPPYDACSPLHDHRASPVMTPKKALLYLAGLEESCANCGGKGILGGEPDFVGEKTVVHTHYACQICKGTGKRPVLDLREPCPECLGLGAISDGHKGQLFCNKCQGRNWVPKQGEMALHQAMHKDGWHLQLYWDTEENRPNLGRNVHFTRLTFSGGLIVGHDANDWLAAAKAMKAAEGFEKLLVLVAEDKLETLIHVKGLKHDGETG